MTFDVAIRDVMGRDFLGVSESDSIGGTARLMLRENAGYAVVLRGSDPVGIVTERDVLSVLLDSDPERTTVADVMAQTVPSVRSDRGLAVAIDRLSATDVPGLVVTDARNGDPIGVVSHRDVATALTYPPELRDEPYDADGGTGTEYRFAFDENDEGDDFETERAAGDAIQSVCESCGVLARSLSAVDGQLLCQDCTDV